MKISKKKFQIILISLASLFCCSIMVIGLFLLSRRSPNYQVLSDVCNNTNYVKEIRDIACQVAAQQKTQYSDESKLFSLDNIDLTIFQYNSNSGWLSHPSCCGSITTLFVQYKGKLISKIPLSNNDLIEKVVYSEDSSSIYFSLIEPTLYSEPIFVINKSNITLAYYPYWKVDSCPIDSNIVCDNPKLAFKKDYDDMKIDIQNKKVYTYLNNKLVTINNFSKNVLTEFEKNVEI